MWSRTEGITQNELKLHIPASVLTSVGQQCAQLPSWRNEHPQNGRRGQGNFAGWTDTSRNRMYHLAVLWQFYALLNSSKGCCYTHHLHHRFVYQPVRLSHRKTRCRARLHERVQRGQRSPAHSLPHTLSRALLPVYR